MPRRATTTSEAPNDIKVKMENVRVKQEKLRNKGKQRASTPEERSEEDAEGEPDEDGSGEQEEERTSRGSKRLRVNGEGDSRPLSNGHGSQQVPKMKTLPRDTDGYIPGSIVRIKLHNFVTYDFVQFHPGPYLNMIFGPNGTGKSSIACAIALGLNFPPSILGRATDLSSFVKIGTDKGFIEIELKGPKGKRNLVVRRNLSSTSNGSTFSLNSSPATGQEIKQKMLELNVQVGNLCSFLPQDKVSEFAAMSPQQLLRETQRAAGDVNLTIWHDTLIAAGKHLKEMMLKIKGEEDTLKQMIDRNAGIEMDVERYKERERIEHAIKLLEVLMPVAQYREARAKFLEIKEKQRKLHAKVKRLKNKNAPVHALLKKMEGNYKDAERERDELKKATQAKFAKLSNNHKAGEKLDKEAEDIVGKLSTLKQEEKERLKAIRNFENEIVKCEAEIEKPSPPDLGTIEQCKDEVRAINLERNDLIQRRADLDGRLKECIDKQAMSNAIYERAQKELKKQDNADVQKLQMMAKWDPDTHDAIIWLRANKDKFRMEVFEPPFMSLSVKDRRYANAIEACFVGNQIKSFVTQCREDCDTLNYHINDEKALGRKARVTTWFRAYHDNLVIPPPMNPEEMANLRFDGYAIDYVDYPAGMEWFLKRDINLHRTAITLNGGAIDVNKTMQLVARPCANHGGGAVFINGATMNIVTRSRYGRKAVANLTRDVYNARNLVVPTIDSEVKQRIENDIRTAQQDMEMYEKEKVEINRGIKQIGEEDEVFKQRLSAVNSRKIAITKEEKRLVTAKSRLSRVRKELVELRNKPPPEQKKVELRKRLLHLSKKRIQHAKDFTDLVHSIVAEQGQCTLIGLQYLQIGANRAALQDLCRRKDDKYENALVEYNEMNKTFQKIKAESKLILERSRHVLAAASEEIQKEYGTIEEVRLLYEKELELAKKQGRPEPDPSGVDFRTVDELQAELETQRANLDMNLNTNPGVVEEYEKRKRDIQELEKTIADRKKKANKVEQNIKSARDNWEPALEKLVASIGEKFSATFDRISCAGEIRISQHEDYEKWAIDILVKFRDSEKLQLLTAHRQSGGERSLTTILYLMSLTEEARAPFSLVDEINQGMDQRAERVVHNSMVNVTCKAESAQYFLITPKLLPDLMYHERMKILCVNNGEWLPDDGNSGKMMNMIDGYVASRRN